MQSMTGYGRGVASIDGLKITIEISSINRKQSEITMSLPRELEFLDSKFRDLINASLSRGRISVRVTIDSASGKITGSVHLNTELARQYLKEVKRLRRDLKFDGEFSYDVLLRSPGVVEMINPLDNAEKLWSSIEPALKKALSALLKMRRSEGAALRSDLTTRMKTVSIATGHVLSLAPQVTARYRLALKDRLSAAGLDLALDDERLVKEIALFADRSDITEELTRLQSHLSQFSEIVKSSEPVGRTLDFLVQEMNREINTIGSKANDASIAAHVITIKAELERFREQAQNIE